MSGFPLPKKKKILIALAALLLVVMVTLPFLINKDRVRTDLTLVSKGTVLKTLRVQGVYGWNSDAKTLRAPGRSCKAPAFLLGKPVKKGAVLLQGADGFVLVAPFDGFVTALQEGEAAYVTVSRPLSDRLLVYADKKGAAALKKGQRLISEDGKSVFGVVEDFGAAVLEAGDCSGIPVQISLKEGSSRLEDQFLPGERFTLQIELERAEECLYLPTKCLSYDASGNPFVYVVNSSHRAEIVFPKFGIIGDQRAEILGGLTMDERVVLTVPDKLHEGTKVLPAYPEG